MANTDDTREQRIDDALQNVDANKRAFLKALLVGTAFGAPTVASFSMKGISSYTVHAQAASNITLEVE